MKRTFKLRSRTGRVLKTVMADSPRGAIAKSKKGGVIVMTSTTKSGRKLYVYSVDKKKNEIIKRAEWVY